jgi:hypothetical protein
MGLLIKGDYSRKALVVGAIVASKGEVKVRAPVSGTIQILEAEFGERVGKGGEGVTLLTIQTVNQMPVQGRTGFH